MKAQALELGYCGRCGRLHTWTGEPQQKCPLCERELKELLDGKTPLHASAHRQADARNAAHGTRPD